MKTNTTQPITKGKPVEWTTTRRAQLAKRVRELFPAWAPGCRSQDCLSYCTELEKLVPAKVRSKLSKDIKKHNARVSRARELADKNFNRNYKSRVAVARFGTDAQCSALAQEIIALEKQ